MFSDVHRWRDHLQSVSEAYSHLHAEHLAGWQTPALDAWYKQRQRPDATPPRPSASSRTVFAGGDMSRLCDRYASHAALVLPAAAPDVFCRFPHGAAGGGGGSFLDLGSAPGGVSKFLARRLRWRGVGVTLPEESGGIAMDRSWAPGQPPYRIVEGNVATDEWRSGIAQAELFFFVNGGAVQDFGQRESEAAESERSGANGQNGAVLPWFTLLVPQLRAAMEFVKDGGAVMLVFGVPQCASLAIMIAMLKPIIHGSVRVFETMHLTKSPVYILLTGVGARRDDAAREVWTSTVNKMTVGERDFWLGETDEGFALAKEGFEIFRKDLELVWKKRTAYMSRRRLQAVKEMEAKETKDRDLKRSREDN